MKSVRVTLLLSLSVMSALASPPPLPNEAKDRAVGAGAAGGRPGGERTVQKFETVMKAAKHHGLASGYYAFYAIHDERDQGEGNEEVNRLTRAIGGSHYALIVGRLLPYAFRGSEVDMRFLEGEQKPNGNGEKVRGVNNPFIEDKRVQYAYVGEVPYTDKTTMDRKGTIWTLKFASGMWTTNPELLQSVEKVLVNPYNVRSNNCKTFVDNLYESLQHSDGSIDSGPAGRQGMNIEAGRPPSPRPGTCRCQ